MNCNSCVKQTECGINDDVRNAFGVCRAWEAIPAEPTFSASLATAGLKMAEESAKKAEQERDLAIWWEAYRAALSGYLANQIGYDHKDAGLCANQALSDYRAKREELCK